MDILLYSYCSLFHLDPLEAKDTPISMIQKMLLIHGEVKTLEHEQLNKIGK